MMLTLMASLAWGNVPIGPSSQKGTLDTPFGPVQAQVLERMCRSESIVIGTVSSVSPFMKVMTNKGVPVANRIHTDLTMRVERDLRGDNPSAIDFTVEGGTLNRSWVPTPGAHPQPDVGARFMVGFTRLKVNTIPWPKGQPIFEATFWVDPTVDLPSENEISNELEAACANF